MKKLPISLLILCLCDIALTLYGLSIGLQEGNPFMQAMISTWYGISIKVILTSLVALWLYVRKARKTLIFVNMFMGLVVLNNLLAITLMLIYASN